MLTKIIFLPCTPLRVEPYFVLKNNYYSLSFTAAKLVTAALKEVSLSQGACKKILLLPQTALRKSVFSSNFTDYKLLTSLV